MHRAREPLRVRGKLFLIEVVFDGRLGEDLLRRLVAERAEPLAKGWCANDVERHEPAERYAILVRQWPARLEVREQGKCVRLVPSKKPLNFLSEGLRPPVVEFPADAAGTFVVLTLHTVMHSDLLPARRGAGEAPYEPRRHRVVLPPSFDTHLELEASGCRVRSCDQTARPDAWAGRRGMARERAAHAPGRRRAVRRWATLSAGASPHFDATPGKKLDRSTRPTARPPKSCARPEPEPGRSSALWRAGLETPAAI